MQSTSPTLRRKLKQLPDHDHLNSAIHHVSKSNIINVTEQKPTFLNTPSSLSHSAVQQFSHIPNSSGSYHNPSELASSSEILLTSPAGKKNPSSLKLSPKYGGTNTIKYDSGRKIKFVLPPEAEQKSQRDKRSSKNTKKKTELDMIKRMSQKSNKKKTIDAGLNEGPSSATINRPSIFTDEQRLFSIPPQKEKSEEEKINVKNDATTLMKISSQGSFFPNNKKYEFSLPNKPSLDIPWISTNRSDFKPWNTNFVKHKGIKPTLGGENGEFSGRTSYNSTYLNFGSPRVIVNKPIQQSSVFPEIPFKGESTYKQNYSVFHDVKPIKVVQQRSKPPFAAAVGIPLLVDTSSLKAFQPLKAIVSPKKDQKAE